MAARKPGRYLAPIALLAAIAAVFLLVRAHVVTSSHASTRPTIPRTLAHSPSGHSSSKRGPSVYTVKQGDTLSGISVRTGVPVATLQSLNPGLNPNALQTGQRLRLRR
jgi:nucleoid-associated protein YgaU